MYEFITFFVSLTASIAVGILVIRLLRQLFQDSDSRKLEESESCETITIHDPREKGNRPIRGKDVIATQLDKLADAGLGLFIRTPSFTLNSRVDLTRELLLAFPYPWLCFSVEVEHYKGSGDFINSLPDQFRVIHPPNRSDVISIICEHSPENVNALFQVYNSDQGWYLWTFGVGYDSSYPSLIRMAKTSGILNFRERLEQIDDGVKELMPYYIACDEDWNTIQIRCMDTKLYDPFVKYAQDLIDARPLAR